MRNLPWTTARKHAATRHGSHKSAKDNIAFLREELPPCCSKSTGQSSRPCWCLSCPTSDSVFWASSPNTTAVPVPLSTTPFPLSTRTPSSMPPPSPCSLATLSIASFLASSMLTPALAMSTSPRLTLPMDSTASGSGPVTSPSWASFFPLFLVPQT